MTSQEISWSGLAQWRAECRERFGTIHEVPIVDIGAELDRVISGAGAILDVGAGKETPLRARVGHDKVYRTLDADPEGTFDYAHVSEIPDGERFDLAVANQVLEHMSVQDARETVGGVLGVLKPAGRFTATVPNPQHPVRQWDPTHVTPWPLFDLYSLLRGAGFEVERVARYGKRRLTRRPLRRMIVKAVAREYRVDWCDSLLIVGVAPSA